MNYNEARLRIEQDRILALFRDLALALDKKAEECGDDNDEDVAVGLAWTAAASSVRRVCDEAMAGAGVRTG
jgi:hypothetical protein